VRSLENFARASNVQDRLPRPSFVRVELTDAVIAIEIRSEVGQMHVVVAMRQQRVMDWSANAGFVTAEVV
jgi:hypothetical protein